MGGDPASSGHPFDHTVFRIAFGLGALVAPVQILAGDYAARFIADRQPLKLAAIEGLETTRSHAPLRSPASSRFPSGLSLLARPRPGAVVIGLDSVPRRTTARRSSRCCGRPSSSWSPIGTGLAALAAGTPVRHRRRRAAPLTLVLARGGRRRPRCGRRAGGRLDRDRGRTPTVDRLRRAADRRCGDAGAQHPVRLLRPDRGVRRADRSDRVRPRQPHPAPTSVATPPSPTGPTGGPSRECGAGCPPGPVDRRHPVRALRRRRLRGWVLGPRRRRGATGSPAPRPDRTLHRTGVGSQPRLADLRAGDALDVLPAGLLGGAVVDVPAADVGGGRHHPARGWFRHPQDRAPGLRAANCSAQRSPRRRSSPRTRSARSPAVSPPAGCRPATPPPTR